MSGQARYQIFVSSTYEDLREERQQTTQAILEVGCFPSGMELFPASDETQWELIKRVIEESDYYVVVVGGRYGSIGPSGNSFTEMEYDFAVEKGIPVLGFVKTGIEEIPSKHVETDPVARKKLDMFRSKVMQRTCRKFQDPNELGMAVMKSLVHETRVRPRVGWVRGDFARTDADRQRELKLQERLDEAVRRVAQLERELRDGAILVDELPRHQLAQGSDILPFTVTYRNQAKEVVSEDVPVTWDEVFRAIGPSMFGYISRRAAKFRGESGAYPFEDCLVDLVRSKIIARCQGREIRIPRASVDACVFQFKELGYIKFKEVEKENGELFRGITLTEAGERYLAVLSTARKIA